MHHSPTHAESATGHLRIGADPPLFGFVAGADGAGAVHCRPGLVGPASEETAPYGGPAGSWWAHEPAEAVRGRDIGLYRAAAHRPVRPVPAPTDLW